MDRKLLSERDLRTSATTPAKALSKCAERGRLLTFSSRKKGGHDMERRTKAYRAAAAIIGCAIASGAA